MSQSDPNHYLLKVLVTKNKNEKVAQNRTSLSTGVHSMTETSRQLREPSLLADSSSCSCKN